MGEARNTFVPVGNETRAASVWDKPKKRTFVVVEQLRETVQEERAKFRDVTASIPADKLVFLDEAGCNRAMAPRYGWSPQGMRSLGAKPVNYGKNITMLGAIRADGPLVLRSYEGPMDRSRFEKWLRRDLGPRLKPDDVVVMDNLRSHHGGSISKIIESFGAHVLYLPPYSPDLNPIEMVWSMMKQRLRRAAVRDVPELKRTIAGIWSRYTKRSFVKLYATCGYA